jgi:deoxyribonuclease-4
MIKFGPSGNSELFRLSGFSESIHSPKWVKEMGLDLFEYSFGRGVNLSKEKAEIIGRAFSDYNVELSVHAPYFINFATTEEDKANNSYRYVLQSLEFAKIMGAKRVVFHPSSQGKLSWDDAVELTKKRLVILADKIYDKGYDDMLVCPETMGKSAQIGTEKEIAEFCTIAPFYVPAVDFGHLNARTNGGLKTVEDFIKVLDVIESIAGREKLDKMHVHFSKIMYSGKGEVKHLTFDDTEYGPEFSLLAKALKIKGVEPYIVCESAGTQDVDAKEMKEIYFNS